MRKKAIYIMKCDDYVFDQTPYSVQKYNDFIAPPPTGSPLDCFVRWRGQEPVMYRKLVKIGISVDPEQRSYQVADELGWCNLDILFEQRSGWAKDIEHALHQQYSHKRKCLQCTGGSEFFDLNGCEILICINTILTNAQKPKWIK